MSGSPRHARFHSPPEASSSFCSAQTSRQEDAEKLLLHCKVSGAALALNTPLLGLIRTDEIRADAVSVLSKMLRICAFECAQTCHYMDHAADGAQWELKVLQLFFLKSLKIVTDLVSREDMSGWCIRSEWLRSTQTTMAPCRGLQPIFVHPIECERAVPSIAWFPFELASFLSSHGWSLSLPLCKMSELRLMCGEECVLNDPQCAKVFFVWRGSINVKYWTCLALTEAMPDMLRFPEMLPRRFHIAEMISIMMC